MMKRSAKSLTLLAALTISAQPCIAADLAAQNASRQSGSFAGAYLHVPLSSSKKVGDEARAGLRLGMSHLYRSGDPGGGERRIDADIVDLGLFQSGRPSLMVGGRQLLAADGHLALKEGDGGGVSPWLIVGGVVILALGVGAVVLADRLECKDHDDEC